MWNDLLDLTFVEEYWANAAHIDPLMLERLFIASHELCVAYAPTLDFLDEIPMRYKLAEILWAQHLWNTARGSDDEPDEFGVVQPNKNLMYQAMDLLRPKNPPLKKLGRR